MTLFINWAVKPFTMYLIVTLYLAYLFRDFIPGTEILKTGQEVALWRSYIPGTILLGVNATPIPWKTILLSVTIYVELPLVAGYFTRKLIIRKKGMRWFYEKFLHLLMPVSIAALLATLLLLFSFKGEIIVSNPLTIVWIAIPLFVRTVLIFRLGYFLLARVLRLSYRDAAPAAMIGASNHYEVAIPTAATLFGVSSGAALAAVVGVLIEVPVMLMLVRICRRTRHLFGEHETEPYQQPGAGAEALEA